MLSLQAATSQAPKVTRRWVRRAGSYRIDNIYIDYINYRRLTNCGYTLPEPTVYLTEMENNAAIQRSCEHSFALEDLKKKYMSKLFSKTVISIGSLKPATF